MRTDRDFSPTTPNETRNLAFDFRHDTFELTPAEYLVSAVFSLAVVETDAGATEDSTPSSRLSGAATIADNQNGETDMAAVQRVTGLVDGNKYRVLCRATTSRGQVLALYADVWCRLAHPALAAEDYSPSLAFSDARNSQYLPLLEDI